MRPVLALDTATDHVALGVGDLDAPGRVIAARDFPAPRAANTVLTAEIERVLASADIMPRDLAAVVCGRGPGSFTGVRIGVATAKGIAHALGVPLVGVGTLDAVARRANTEGLLGVVGDAMRGEVYPALFRVHAGIVARLTIDRVAGPREVAAEWAALDEPVALAGNALGKHAEVFRDALGDRGRVLAERVWVPDGASLIEAAWAARGEMTTRGLYVFKHDSELGNAPAHALFERIQAMRKADVPRSFTDYDVTVNEAAMPAGVTLLRKV